ncbi:MAG: energy transducer TonB [Deltaproteobacteria bacterium]|nr:energy transducer TonB [Deltaproteobacteria bacterium]
MRDNRLKFPFLISMIFHGATIIAIASLYPSVKKAVIDITPIEFVHAQKNERPLPQAMEAPKKEEPKPVLKGLNSGKIAKIIPPAPRQEEKKEEIKKEPEKIIEDQNISPVSEPPPPQIVSEAEPAAAIDATAASSKYEFEGGTGKGSADETVLFKTMVRTKIERAKFYPRWARERGFEGVVGVHFTIQPDGNVIGIKVVRPCHCDILNKAACEAIMKAVPFSPRPKEMENKEMAMEVNIGFRLE